MRENEMAKLNAFSIFVVLSLAGTLVFSTSSAFGQTAKELQGAWTAVSVETTGPDGKKSQPFGAEPQGLLIFDGEGRYSLQICSAKRPKFAANNRTQGTPEENK
jgi:hypothetical protein